jgi:bifunctional non-homologous end joining protein LigD
MTRAKKPAARQANPPGRARHDQQHNHDIETAITTRLKAYTRKRDFERTPEPTGVHASPRRETARQFVVQKHAASHLHYDFRLELDGVLLSWSVPKGPSLKAGLRRLAVRTEDHPLDYAGFEGVIPKGEYGGGTVIVWDRGTWIPVGNTTRGDAARGDAARDLAAGRLSFELHGEKLRGRFHLVRTRNGDKHESWLLIKGRDDDASDTIDIAAERPRSAISGRTLEQVAEVPSRVWHAKRNHPAPPAPAHAPKTHPATQDTLALVKRLPMPFALSHLDKVLYPSDGLRKADIIAYYVAVASFMLPHVKNRPLTLLRVPNGVGTKGFFQKHANDSVPDAVLRVPIEEEKSKREIYMAVKDVAGLVALVQLGVLEVHIWGCHAAHVESPDRLVFDIDPAEDVAWDRCVEAAMELRERLIDVGLKSFVQTTGGKGLHVVAPLSRPLSWEQHKAFSRALCERMAEEQPARYLTNMRKSLRKGKIFLDYLRNARGATAIAPYSTRARETATVAAPLTWDELAEGVKPNDFNVRSMVERISEIEEDPWKDYAGLKQSISAAALRSLGVK